jgi:hypothetical protein
MSTAATTGSARDIESEDTVTGAEAPAGGRTRIRTGVVAGVLTLVAAASACQPNAVVSVVGQLGANSVDQAVIDQARRQTQLHPFLTCVRQHESDRGPYPHINGYRAKNPRSTASGAYQFLDTTWRNVAPKVGGGQYARAMDAPTWVQDDAAMWMINNGWKSAWNGTGCK